MFRWHLLYIAIIIVLSIILINKDSEIQQIEVPVYIPAQTDSFLVEKPVPIYISKDTSIPKTIYIPTNLPPSKCIEEYTNLYNICDSLTKIRTYSNIYVDSIFFIINTDTIWLNMNINVIDTTQGILNNQKMKYIIKPKTTFTTIIKFDSYKNTIFVGGGLNFQNQNIIGTVGYDTKKYVINYTGNIVKSNEITVGIKLNR